MSNRPKVGIVVIAYNLAEMLDGFLMSCVSDECDVTVYLYLHSTPELYPAVSEVCQRWATKPHVRFSDIGTNRGLATSWSEGLIASYDGDGNDLTLICNDDTVLGTGDITRFYEFVRDIEAGEKATPDAQKCGMLTCLGWHNFYGDNPHLGQNPWQGFGFSLFAVTNAGWETLGCFDRSFFPIYCEDCDFGRRLALSGLCMKELKGTKCIHWGSVSANDAELQKQHSTTNPLNYAYYGKKWGSSSPNPNEFMGTETFTVPFNDPAFDLKIRAEDYLNPYGPLYDRTDFDEVVKR